MIWEKSSGLLYALYLGPCTILHKEVCSSLFHCINELLGPVILFHKLDHDNMIGVVVSVHVVVCMKRFGCMFFAYVQFIKY